MAALSRARVVVVPTATIRRPAARAASIRPAAAGAISYSSGSTTCASTSSTRTGLNVPYPTCSVMSDALDAGRAQPREEPLGEVESRRGGGHRSRDPGEHGLIPLAIRRRVGALDVRRQGHVPDALDHLLDRPPALDRQANVTSPERVLRHDFARERTACSLAHERRARPELLARVHERVPRLGVEAPEQEALDRPAARHTTAQQARREHPGVVDHQQVAGAQEGRQVGHPCAHGRPRRALEDHQPRVAPLVWRHLRHQIRRADRNRSRTRA